eukprot:TRINITY_DN7155_c0_g1_i1.p1 TRINITY_DN7155_c0_g1~~TRINITY_DN7155_c0_g1_i1.p1  ORF type:complete len:1276 (+),score=361.41 TRINITY_DN7155_c0_g1_i1:115-3942(+)
MTDTADAKEGEATTRVQASSDIPSNVIVQLVLEASPSLKPAYDSEWFDHDDMPPHTRPPASITTHVAGKAGLENAESSRLGNSSKPSAEAAVSESTAASSAVPPPVGAAGTAEEAGSSSPKAGGQHKRQSLLESTEERLEEKMNHLCSEGFVTANKVADGDTEDLIGNIIPFAEEEEEDEKFVNRKELIKVAKEHRLSTACTIRNDDGTHRHRSVVKTSTIDLGVYGVGVQLYFDLHFYLACVFGLLFLLNLPMIILCLSGSLVEHEASDDASIIYKIISLFGVANLGHCPEEGCKTKEDYHERLLFKGGSMKVKEVTFFLGVMDGLSMLVFIAFVVWFHFRYIPKAVDKQDEAHVTAADFSVEVSGLPRSLKTDHSEYEVKLKKHFQTVLAACGVDTPDCVKEVSLVREYDGAIKLFAVEGEILKQQKETNARRKVAEKLGKEAEAARLEKHVANLQRKLDKIEAKLKHQNHSNDRGREVCGAFVMFDHEAQKMKVLRAYRHAQSFWARLLQPKRLRFDGVRIQVRQAAEPSSLFWENLDFSPKQHMFRRMVTLLIAALLLFVGATLLIVSRSQAHQDIDFSLREYKTWVLRNDLKFEADECVEFCNMTMMTFDPNAEDYTEACQSDPATSVGFWNKEGKHLTPLLRNGGCWRTCGGDAAHDMGPVMIFRQGEHDRKTPCGVSMQMKGPLKDDVHFTAYGCSAGVSLEEINWESGPSNVCFQLQASTTTEADDSSNLMTVKISPDTRCKYDVPERAMVEYIAEHSTDDINHVVNCFCKGQATAKGSMFMFPPYDSAEAKMCKDWSQLRQVRVVLFMVGIVAVLVINQLLLLLFEVLDRWARFKTVTDLAKKQVVKIFIAQLMNTGVTVVLVAANLQGITSGVPGLDVMKIGKGEHDDITPAWFIMIGTGLLITIVGQMGSALMLPPTWCLIVDPIVVILLRKGVVTQEVMNDIYALPEWGFAPRLAETLTLMVCATMYAAGMPILYGFVAAYCAVAYWVDAWMLLRGCKQPPAYSSQSIEVVTRMLPLAACLHAIVTLWVFGNQLLFPSGWGPFLGFGEWLFGVTEADYETIKHRYHTSTPAQQSEIFSDYLQARMLDTARMSCWPLFVILSIFILFVLNEAVIRVVLQTFCKETFKKTKKFFLRLLRLAHEDGVSGGITAVKYAAAKEQAAKTQQLFSYKFSENRAYAAAYQALSYDPDGEESQKPGDDQEASPHSGGLLDRMEERVSHVQGRLMNAAEETLSHVYSKMGRNITRNRRISGAEINEITMPVSV